MSDPSTLHALADRVEALTKPDRDVDALIAPLLGLRVVDEGHPIGRMCYDDIGCAQLMPRFTYSVDAAMTLVPGADYTVSLSIGRVNIAVVTHCHDDPLAPPTEYEAMSATPALALCVAALRARARSGDGGGNG